MNTDEKFFFSALWAALGIVLDRLLRDAFGAFVAAAVLAMIATRLIVITTHAVDRAARKGRECSKEKGLTTKKKVNKLTAPQDSAGR